jgi:lantibiotic modifying enzyme
MTATTSDGLAEAAAIVAEQLAETAIWDRGRCTWLGGTAAARRVIVPLGGDLYDGTAGVALFLAEASACLGEERLGAVALGAARHACEQVGDDEGGLYAGPLGVVLAALRVAHQLDVTALERVARRRLDRWRRRALPSSVPDLMNGWAGVVVALLALPEVPWAVAAAVERGERLLERAERRPAGWSWREPGERGVNLCGLAHGTSGIALALVELFAVTGDERFREAAEQAFAYERSWLLRTGGVWPDLRGVGLRGPFDAPLPGSATWCHGAPGALLARVRARSLGVDADEFEAAQRQTRAIADRILAEGGSGPSLCHGAAGVADALLCAGDAGPAPARLVHEALGSGATSPGLFLGVAGVAHACLRIMSGAVRSVLLVHR